MCGPGSAISAGPGPFSCAAGGLGSRRLARGGHSSRRPSRTRRMISRAGSGGGGAGLDAWGAAFQALSRPSGWGSRHAVRAAGTSGCGGAAGNSRLVHCGLACSGAGPSGSVSGQCTGACGASGDGTRGGAAGSDGSGRAGGSDRAGAAGGGCGAARAGTCGVSSPAPAAPAGARRACSCHTLSAPGPESACRTCGRGCELVRGRGAVERSGQASSAIASRVSSAGTRSWCCITFLLPRWSAAGLSRCPRRFLRR